MSEKGKSGATCFDYSFEKKTIRKLVATHEFRLLHSGLDVATVGN